VEKIKLEIIGISYSQSQSGAYALILGEIAGRRRLPIIIGGFEAQAIAIELEKMKPQRPLTHDLFRNFAEAFEIKIVEVIINKFHEGVFYAKLICFNGKEEQEIDARTSDAVALAVRFECPIYTYEKVLSATGVVIDEESEKETKIDQPGEIAELLDDDEPITATEFSELPLEELEKLLEVAIAEEAFERASLIRDEIRRREEQ
jgi:uncharacterized protein